MRKHSLRLFVGLPRRPFLETSVIEFCSSWETEFHFQISLGNTDQNTELVLPESFSNNKVIRMVNLEKGDIAESILKTFDPDVVL